MCLGLIEASPAPRTSCSRNRVLRGTCASVSAIPSFSTKEYPFENVNTYVRDVVKAFGARRCFWGTDLTRQLNHGLSYTMCIEHFTKHMGFTAEQLEWIMGRGINECLDWPATAPKLAPRSA